MLDSERTSLLFRGSHQGHERLVEPTDTKSIGRFHAMAPSDIAWIERECAEGMRLLGYEPVTSAAAQSRAKEPPGKGTIGRLRRGLLSRAEWSKRLFFLRLQLRSHLWSLQRTV